MAHYPGLVRGGGIFLIFSRNEATRSERPIDLHISFSLRAKGRANLAKAL
jgi:hypothetical protein